MENRDINRPNYGNHITTDTLEILSLYRKPKFGIVLVVILAITIKYLNRIFLSVRDRDGIN